jgi:chromosome partitioning protein
MAKIFTIANRKGGAGKTTVATNLTVALSQKGSTLLVDTDDQLSAFNWNEYRQDKLASLAILNNLSDTIQPHFDEYEFILIDMAGRDSELLREALLISDVLIVPTQPSILDLEILPYVADKVATAQEINPDLKSYVVINRASSNYRNVLTLTVDDKV